MKLGLICISCVVGLLLGTSIALAMEPKTVIAEAPRPIPAMDTPVSIELPELHVAQAPVVRYVAKKHAAPKPKQWVCGEMYENKIGGRNRDCEWQ